MPGLKVDRATSQRLGKIRQRDTAPEQIARQMLTRLGLKYRLTNRGLPGSPDVANRKCRWAVFVHGCFWHSHSGCYRATVPKRNRDFWLAKFAANRARDRRAIRILKARGYAVVVLWECDLEERPKAVTRRLQKALGQKRPNRES